MELRVRIFIDFWNFQINWNDRTGRAGIDWPKVPPALLGEVGKLLKVAGSSDTLQLDETRVYASYDSAAENDRRLKGWLDGWLDRQTSFRVFARERRSRPRPVRCSSCGHEVGSCPSCQQAYRHSPEKGVDAAIVTDLFSLAWEEAYAVGILLTSDADFVPAVERLQEKGIKIVNATWKGYGHQLARACWGSFLVDSILDDCRRP